MSKLVSTMIVIIILGSTAKTSISTSLTVECGDAIQKVTTCLTYASGKAVEPSKGCCDAVSGIKEKQPVCLCFFIGQAHNGSQEMKSLGIQEPKLLQLPSACHLSATTSNCPKLLGISPTSPAAAIFVNNNATTTSSSTTTTTGDKSNGFKRQNGVFIVVFLSFLVFLVGNNFP